MAISFGRTGYTKTAWGDYNKPIQQMSDQEFNRFLADKNKFESRSRLAFGGNTSANSNSGGTGTSTNNSSTYGMDWSNSNGGFSWDNQKTMAYDMARMQQDFAKEQMQTSFDFRSKEKGLDSDIRQREANQKFGFEEALQKLQQNHQLEMQGRQYNQEQLMFGMRRQAQDDSTASARRVSQNLFFGRGRR